MGFHQTFKALSDPTRRAILERLKNGRLTAGEIASAFDLSAATVSHHLAMLRQAELVIDQREGKHIYYEINTSVIDEILTWVTSLREGDKTWFAKIWYSCGWQLCCRSCSVCGFIPSCPSWSPPTSITARSPNMAPRPPSGLSADWAW